MRASEVDEDVLAVLADGPLTEWALARELLLAKVAVGAALRRAVVRRQVVTVAPSAGRPVVRWALAEGSTA